MSDRSRARLISYGLAVLAPAVTLLVRWPLDAVLGDRVQPCHGRAAASKEPRML
jgi:hypothetical protein